MNTFNPDDILKSSEVNENFAGLADGSEILTDAIQPRHIEVQQDWTALTLKNGWATYSTDWTTGSYWKDSLGFVHLTGLVKNGSGNIATLPVGYRPKLTEVFHIITSGETEGRVDILSDGEIVPTQIAGTAWVTLSDITFYAEN